MATPDAQAKQAWHQALKLRKHLTKQIEKLRNESSSSGTNVSQFDAISESLEQFRFACVSTIFLDFEFAVSETSEDALWQVHSTINSEYRRVLGKLRSNSHVVERRKVETKYNHFLRIAQQFYKGYIQRLSARYDVQELKRAALGIEAEQMAPADIISPVSEDLKAKVLTSCHSTLIRLGDLARYRVQAKHKKSGYETALAYYSIAHDLVPDSGFAFHQMGIVNQDEGNHLDVVYHFYRAWAVKDPHPNAKQNLEAKFRALQNANSNSRNKPATPTPNDTFILWFVRLQALFYKGEAVSAQHTELDKEVIHRLTMAAKEPQSAPILFKMSLVNMAAYCISSSKYKDSKAEPAFRFWQYSLDFNIRFIYNLCEVIQNELKTALSQKEDASSSVDATSEKLPTAQALLPILRIYCIWLAAHRHEIFNATDALDKSLTSMVQTLANVFTLLAAETYSRQDLATCPYLLSEDLEMRGLKSFSEDQVPLACRPHYNDDGKLKPHLQSPEERLPISREFAARMLDTLRCAYFLAEDPAVPLGTRVLEGWLIFECKAVDHPQSEMTIPDSAATASLPASAENSQANEIKTAPAAPAIEPTVAASTPKKQAKVSGPKPKQNSKQPENTAINGLDDADKTVLNMLSPFIDCPSPESEHPEDETSYGMHTATANEIAQELLGKFPPEQQAEHEAPTGSLAAPGGFTPMYWANWNSRATPTSLGTSNPLLANGGLPGHRSPGRSSRGSVPIAEAFEDSLLAPSQRSPRNIQPRSASGFGPSSGFADDTHRNQLLHTFTTPQTSRQPSATGWSQGQNQAVAAQWGALGIDMGPASSGSNFTNMSSLYQGTPGNGFPYGGMTAYGGAMPNQMTQNGASREQNSSSSTRHFQMDKAAWNYDAAILQRALQGEE